MKRYSIIFFLSIFITPFSFIMSGQMQAPPGAPGMPQLSEKEIEALNEWAKVLEGFSDEELEELAQIGETYMQELEAQGIDPMEFLFHEESPIWEKPPVFGDEEEPEEKKDEAVPTPAPAPLHVPTESTEPKVLTVTDKEKIQQIKHKLEDISDKIGSLRQKAESKRTLAEKLQPFEYALTDIVYFVLTIKEDHLLKYLFEKKFESLYHLLMELHQALETYEPQVYVTEFSLEGKDPYTILDVRSSDSFQAIYKKYQTLSREENPFTVEEQLKKQGKSAEAIEKEMKKAQERWNKIVWAYEALQSKENSIYAFETLLNVFQQMLYKHDLLAKLKEVLAMYDPESLKLKQEQEKREEKARKAQEQQARQRPPWTQPVFEPAPAPRRRATYGDSSYQPQYGTPSYTAPSYSSAQPTIPRTASTGTPQKGKKTFGPSPAGAQTPTPTQKPDATPTVPQKKGAIPRAPRSTETDRRIFRVQDALDDIQNTITENESLITNLKSYLTKPYNEATDKTVALQVNQLFAKLTQDFSALNKMLKNDLASFKDNVLKKNSYTQSVSNAYKKFMEQEKVKTTLETLAGFRTQNDTINFKGETISANPIKRFLVAGISVPSSQQGMITDELLKINNPLVTRDAKQDNAINYIQQFKAAYNDFDKQMTEKFAPKNK